MNQQPDKLFRDKLENYQKAAPASAWDRIDAGLAKKDRPVLWYRIAAAILLLAVAAFLLWPRGGQQTSPDLTSNKNKPALDKTEGKDNELKDNTESQSDKEDKPAPQISNETLREQVEPKIARKQNGSNKIKSQPSPTPDQKVEQHDDVQLAVQSADNNESKIVDSNITEQTALASAQPVEKTTVTLIFTADEVNDKYLNKEALAQATSEKKKSSTFKKLLEKAQDLKNNQDPFGDLRQKKNEILALNFKNDKRGQNK